MSVVDAPDDSLMLTTVIAAVLNQLLRIGERKPEPSSSSPHKRRS